MTDQIYPGMAVSLSGELSLWEEVGNPPNCVVLSCTPPTFLGLKTLQHLHFPNANAKLCCTNECEGAWASDNKDNDCMPALCSAVSSQKFAHACTMHSWNLRLISATLPVAGCFAENSCKFTSSSPNMLVSKAQSSKFLSSNSWNWVVFPMMLHPIHVA